MSTSEQKVNRLLYGLTGKPVIGNIVLRKEMKFDHEEMDRGAFIIINTHASPPTQTSANLYGGKAAKEAGVKLAAGKNYDPAGMTHPITDWSKVTKKWADKGYKQVPIGDCPIAQLPEGKPEGDYSKIVKTVEDTAAKAKLAKEAEAAKAKKDKEKTDAKAETAEAKPEAPVEAKTS